MQHKSGIYKITCISNGKVYIGQSINVNDRKREHIYKLNIKNHKSINIKSGEIDLFGLLQR